MDNRVYYGEYSLKHWIDLVLKKNVILPSYQRYFVWNEKKVETLIDTFRKNQFIPLSRLAHISQVGRIKI